MVKTKVKEPPKKASPCAVLFAFKRDILLRRGFLGDFLPSHFIEILHAYFTVGSYRQENFLLL